jgi:hypothetical protein
MARRAVPAFLALCAFLADVGGAHGFALLVLLAAIPAGFALVVSCYGDTVDTDSGLRRAIAAGLGLFLIVLSAALRSPAVVGGVPRIALTALALAPMPWLYAGVRTARTRPARREFVAADEEDEFAEAA